MPHRVHMARYTFKDGDFIDRETGEPMRLPDRDGLATPAIVSDIQPYISPAGGEYVSGRAARRDDMRKHNCIDANELDRGDRAKPGEFRNKRFAKKHNLKLAEDAR